MSKFGQTWTIKKAASYLGVSEKTLRRWEEKGIVNPFRTQGNQRRYTKEQLDFITKKPADIPPPAIGNHHLPSRYPSFLKTSLILLILTGATAGLITAQVIKNGILPKLQAQNLLMTALKLTAKDSLSNKLTDREINTEVLGASTVNPDFTFNVNVPSTFSETATFKKNISVEGDLIIGGTATLNKITAPNILYGISGGSGISVSTGQTPTITNTGIISLTAGSGISVSGSTITNSDTGSSQKIFKTISVSGQSDIAAGSNTDTLTFVAGTGIVLTNDATNKKLTINGTNPGITDGGTTVYVTTTTDNFGIGTTTASEKLTVTGNALVSGTLNAGGISGKNYNAFATSSQSTSHSLSAANDLYVGGNLEIAGTIYGTLNGGVNAGFSQGAVIFTDASGNLSADSSYFNYDSITHSLSLPGYVSSNIIPYTGSQNDLGSSARRWKNAYVDTLSATTLSVTNTDISGTTSQDFLINSDNVTLDTESSTLTFERGSPAVNSQFKWDATNKYISSNVPFAILPDSGIAYSGTAALIVNQIQNQDILTASASSVTKFTVANNGNITATGTISGLTGITSSGTIILSGLSTGVVQSNSSGVLSNNLGTLNYIPKWSATGLSTTSTIYDNGNVGIGTTAPLAKLDVAGDSSSSGDIYLRGTATTHKINIYDGGSLQIGTSAGGGTATAAFTVTSAGNIGIGTTAPAANWNLVSSASTGIGGEIDVNSLSTGTGLYLSSTSTTFSSGNMMSLYWNPGQATTATGDLLRLNVGSLGVLGNILNVMDNGSSVFSVSQTTITAGLPASFTSPGDISASYDLVFNNPTVSNILSSAPLIIASGELFNSSDLTLRTYNVGNVVVDSQALLTTGAATISGQLQVGTSSATLNTGNFYLTNNATYGKALAILNQTEGADIFTASSSGATKFVITSAGNVGIGTTSPGSLLDVNGTAQLRGSTGGTGLIVDSSGRVGVGKTPESWSSISASGVIATVDSYFMAGTGLKDSSNGNYFIDPYVTSGNSIIVNGNVGIGTTSPNALLQVFGNGTTQVASVSASTGKAALLVDNTIGDLFTASSSGMPRFVITQAGQVGIGTTAPGYLLQVGAAGDGTEARANAWNTLSDAQFKTNISSLSSSSSLSSLLSLNPVAFDWKSNGKTSLGFIAQDVAKLFPDLVSSDQNGVLSLNYAGLTAPIVAAIQEQQNQLSALGSQLSDLGQSVSQLTGLPKTDQLVTENGQLKTDNWELRISSLEDKYASVSAELDKLISTDSNRLQPISTDSAALTASISAQLISTSSALLDGPTALVPNVATILNGEVATVSSLMVTGQSSLYNVYISGAIRAGLLSISTDCSAPTNFNEFQPVSTSFNCSYASIDSLTLPLVLQNNALADVRIMAGKVAIDPHGNLTLAEGDLNLQKGRILGNDSMRGKIIIKAGATTGDTILNWTSAPVSLLLTPSYNTKVWFTNLNEKGFTVNVDTAPVSDQEIDWLAIW